MVDRTRLQPIFRKAVPFCFATIVLCFTLWTRSSGQTSTGLTGVVAITSDDVWAVGYRAITTRGALYSSTLAEHWDGTKWTGVPTPNPQGGCSAFSAVAAINPTDIWAAGEIYEQASCGYTTWRVKPGFLEHWDGTSWTIVNSPDPATKVFKGLAGIAADDVWAVGYVYSNLSYNTAPLIEHWDGSRWTVQSSATIQGAQQVYLFAITAVAADDIWAVGSYSSATKANAPFSEHWDGTAWKVVPVPDAGDFLYSVSFSGTDLWATGYVDLAMHWDGSRWASTSIANSGGGLNAVLALPNGQAWAVGNQFQYPNTLTLIEFWNGSKWSAVPSPNPSSSWNNLFAISGTGLDDAWAVGSSAGTLVGTAATLTEHWDGTAWTVVPSP